MLNGLGKSVRDKQRSKRMSQCEVARLKFIRLDKYGHDFDFQMPNGTKSYQSVLGTLCTLLAFGLMIFYGTLQFIKLYRFDETAIMHSSSPRAFAGDEIITGNLQFAFSLTTYDEITEVEEDPRYATLRGEYRKWGWEDVVEEYLEPIDIHPCTDEDLGIKYDNETGEYSVNYDDRSRTKFFEPLEQSIYDITQYRKKFKCLDKQVGIAGDYNTESF